MSVLTVEDILAEVHAEGLVEDITMSKEASVQSSSSSDFDLNDVEGMASFLKSASIEESVAVSTSNEVVIEQRTFQEKIAEAMILKEVLDEINSPENMFKTAAVEAGYSPEEVDGFLQEKIALNMRQAGQAGKYLAAVGGGAGTAGYLGHKSGKKKGRSKGRKEGFRVGRIVQYQADNNRIRNYLKRRNEQGK